MDTRFLTTTEVASLTRLNKNYLEKLRSQGGGPPFHKPNARLCIYRLQDVLDWLDERRFVNTATPALA